MASRSLDIILFGASGYTGKYCIKELHRQTKTKGRSFTWGIAGRSKAKLRTTISDCQKEIGDDLSNIPIIIANVEDSNSLKRMTNLTKIIINCCGPYRLYGEPVVKVCIESGTHQIDVSGEPGYMEYIQLKYHKMAREKRVYIVSSCGFDSIPGDLGVLFLQRNFKGVLNSVETYLHLMDGQNKGPSFNYATWASLIYGIANSKQLPKIRHELFVDPLPQLKPRLRAKGPIHTTDTNDGWAIPFIGADRSVIYRTQRYLYEHENVRPVQIQTYEIADSILKILGMVAYGNLFNFLIKYKCGQNLLLKYPSLFSAGMFSNEVPSERELNNTKFSLTFCGEGWDEKSVKVGDCDFAEPPNKRIVTYITGYNPMYKITAVTVTLAAVTLITESDRLPERGGVYTPGATFAKTSLIEQLQQNGFMYKIKSRL